MKPKQIEIILAIVAVLLCAGVPAKAIIIEDGQNHIISDATYQTSLVGIDQTIANNPGTQVQILDGAVIAQISAGNYGTIEVDGGTIYMGMKSYDDAAITVNGGNLRGIHAYEQSLVTINSGTFSYINDPAPFDFPYSGILAYGGIVEIHGGTIDVSVESWGGTVYLYGTDFSVAGQQLNYGDHLRDYARNGRVTGTLSDGSSLNTNFFWNGGDIIVVPEPATLCLLALGGLVLRKKRSKNLP